MLSTNKKSFANIDFQQSLQYYPNYATPRIAKLKFNINPTITEQYCEELQDFVEDCQVNFPRTSFSHDEIDLLCRSHQRHQRHHQQRLPSKPIHQQHSPTSSLSSLSALTPMIASFTGINQQTIHKCFNVISFINRWYPNIQHINQFIHQYKEMVILVLSMIWIASVTHPYLSSHASFFSILDNHHHR